VTMLSTAPPSPIVPLRWRCSPPRLPLHRASALPTGISSAPEHGSPSFSLSPAAGFSSARTRCSLLHGDVPCPSPLEQRASRLLTFLTSLCTKLSSLAWCSKCR
jgi:hypothetical protein